MQNPPQAARPAAAGAMPAKPPAKVFFSRREAAAYLGICVRKLDGMVAKREIDHVRIGRRVLLRRETLERQIEAHTVRARRRGDEPKGALA